MTDAPQVTPNAKALTEQAIILVDDLQQFIIESDDDYVSAGEHLKRIKAAQDSLIAERKKATYPLDAAKKVIMEWFEPTLKRLTMADGAISANQLSYRREQQAKREAEIERLRALQIAEARRLEDIMRQAEAIGRPEQAEELRNRALDLRVAEPAASTEVPKVAGQSVRVTWKFRILDADQVPREFCVPDEKKLASMAIRCGAQMRPGQIPGVEFYSVETLATRHSG